MWQKIKSLAWVAIIIAAVIAAGACIASVFLIKEKRKKDQKELEEYLDYSIL